MAGYVELDEELITPEIDCTGWVKLRLDFDKNYTAYVGETDPLLTQTADVDIQSFDEVTGWSDWENLWSIDRTKVDQSVDPSTDSDPVQVDLSAYDGLKIKLRWHYYAANYDYWVAIDDVVLTGEQLAPEKGEVTALAVADGKLSLTWAAFGDGNYTVQYRDSLTSGDWQAVPGFTWPTQDTTWPGEDMAGIPARYYRVTAQ
jgi:hypothetical protein